LGSRSTGLYCVRNRYLHPRLGRWLERDRAGYVDGMNLYQYVMSNPAGLVDPTGLWGLPRWFVKMVSPESAEAVEQVERAAQVRAEDAAARAQSARAEGDTDLARRFDQLAAENNQMAATAFDIVGEHSLDGVVMGAGAGGELVTERYSFGLSRIAGLTDASQYAGEDWYAPVNGVVTTGSIAFGSILGGPGAGASPSPLLTTVQSSGQILGRGFLTVAMAADAADKMGGGVDRVIADPGDLWGWAEIGFGVCQVGAAKMNLDRTLQGIYGRIDASRMTMPRGSTPSLRDSGQIYRRGNFASGDWEGNYVKGLDWSQQNPMTTSNYASNYGLPAGNSSTISDWVIGGQINPGAGAVSYGPAPGIGANAGGAMEFTLSPSDVSIDWFHMP
jgi:hypothetical protein